MLAAADWTVITFIALLTLSFAGLGIVFVGRTIERDAAAPDNEINRLRRRSGGRFITIGASTTLACWLGAIVMVLLTVMPIQR